jgi:hypothetical protein
MGDHRQYEHRHHQHTPVRAGLPKPSRTDARAADGGGRSEQHTDAVQRAHTFTPTQPLSSAIRRSTISSSGSSSSSPSFTPPAPLPPSSLDVGSTPPLPRSAISTSRSPPSGVHNVTRHASHITHHLQASCTALQLQTPPCATTTVATGEQARQRGGMQLRPTPPPSSIHWEREVESRGWMRTVTAKCSGSGIIIIISTLHPPATCLCRRRHAPPHCPSLACDDRACL